MGKTSRDQGKVQTDRQTDPSESVNKGTSQPEPRGGLRGELGNACFLTSLFHVLRNCVLSSLVYIIFS